ncbi:hypothetical protein MMPV_004597 [Pyropia vietnamensis]
MTGPRGSGGDGSLLVAVWTRAFPFKCPDAATAAKLTAASIGVVVLSNLSLQFDSVGVGSYNVQGHAKTTTLLTLNFLAFGRSLEWAYLTGPVIAVTGVLTYTQQKLRLLRRAAALAGAARDGGVGMR